jgi:hypothetical protein
MTHLLSAENTSMNLFTEGCATPENCEKLRQLILTSSCLNSQFLLSKVGPKG